MKTRLKAVAYACAFTAFWLTIEAFNGVLTDKWRKPKIISA